MLLNWKLNVADIHHFPIDIIALTVTNHFYTFYAFLCVKMLFG